MMYEMYFRTYKRINKLEANKRRFTQSSFTSMNAGGNVMMLLHVVLSHMVGFLNDVNFSMKALRKANIV